MDDIYKNNRKWPGRVKFAVILLIILGVSFSIYLIFFRQQSAQQEAENKKNEIIKSLSRHILIPDDDTPTIAVVSDARRLAASNVFYKDAVDGNILAVFKDKIVIYDTENDVIVNISTIDRSSGVVISPSSTPLPSPDKEDTATIEVRNGTTKAGLAKKMADQLIAIKNADVIKYGDAVGVFPKTVVFSRLSAENTVLKAVLGQTGAGVTGIMPAGESATKADILVLIGG